MDGLPVSMFYSSQDCFVRLLASAHRTSNAKNRFMVTTEQSSSFIDSVVPFLSASQNSPDFQNGDNNQRAVS